MLEFNFILQTFPQCLQQYDIFCVFSETEHICALSSWLGNYFPRENIELHFDDLYAPAWAFSA